jgi:hypothetical protein
MNRKNQGKAGKIEFTFTTAEGWAETSQETAELGGKEMRMLSEHSARTFLNKMLWSGLGESQKQHGLTAVDYLTWISDSAASCYMTGHRGRCTDLVPLNAHDAGSSVVSSGCSQRVSNFSTLPEGNG